MNMADASSFDLTIDSVKNVSQLYEAELQGLLQRNINTNMGLDQQPWPQNTKFELASSLSTETPLTSIII